MARIQTITSATRIYGDTLSYNVKHRLLEPSEHTAASGVPSKIMLTVTRNKMQTIDLICEHFTSYNNDVSQHKLVLTGSHHMGKNLKMCTNAYCLEKKSELSELHYIFNLLEAKTLQYLDQKYC